MYNVRQKMISKSLQIHSNASLNEGMAFKYKLHSAKSLHTLDGAL